MSAISIIPERCTGCQSCEMVCSLSHEDSCSPAFSRIQIKKWEEISVFMPIVCQQCEKPPCITICPAGARKRVPETNAVVTDEKRCVGCKSCLYVCPYSAPTLHPLTQPATSAMVDPSVHRSVLPEHFLISLKEISQPKGRRFSGKSFFKL